jgi:peptidoglycan hydrolase CwlO-like protein
MTNELREQIEDEINDTEAEYREARKKQDRLEHELQDLESDASSLEDELDNLNEQVKTKREEYDFTENKVIRLGGILDDLRASLLPPEGD